MKLYGLTLICALAIVVTIPAAAAADAMMNFGTPPSPEIPIFYNDHHVYARPDVLRRSRTLAAIARGGTILVPLRSMFEQMGASVTYDAATRSVTAQKPGASITVTVGGNTAVINAETRPLDQGPIVFRGHVLVPVRVISETLGAYVEWIPSRRLVIVRYKAPQPVPTLVPTAPPTPLPTPIPPPVHHGFIAAGLTHGRVYNEFSAGAADLTHGEHELLSSYVFSAAYLFNSYAVKIDFREDEFCTSVPSTASTLTCLAGPEHTFFNTIDGGRADIRQFTGRQSTFDGRLEYRIADPRIYVGVSYIQTSTNYGYPHLTGPGIGVEKLPDFSAPLGLFASIFYYPTAAGTYTIPSGSNAGTSLRQEFGIVKYDLGATWTLGRSALFVYGGYSGDHYSAKQNAPISQTHSGPYLGLGLQF